MDFEESASRWFPTTKHGILVVLDYLLNPEPELIATEPELSGSVSVFL